MSATSTLERLYSLRELSDAGYSDRTTIMRHIRAGRIPALMTPGGYRIRESDLHFIAAPVVVETDTDTAGGDA
jgi:predicted site-specific integrase-resolvase